MSVKSSRQIQLFFNIVLQIFGSISVKYSLSLKSSWLEHLVLKHTQKKKKNKGNIFGSKYILFILEHSQRAMEQYKHPLLGRMSP